ncbi:hypothetical protein Slin_3538 [Spirosoma linguale DSM 74]|uniref:Uncharacterized protein n=1 Tax=Spirosoma linguale (strain ATCC 33905 / DSM 74 / LMG 10896 / Claus 1) TaxID=504472 RepID=D2QQB2_SPILD|nr:hypothetical protein Slin_3538 [Spirosoma linguale DSM 74]
MGMGVGFVASLLNELANQLQTIIQFSVRLKCIHSDWTYAKPSDRS